MKLNTPTLMAAALSGFVMIAGGALAQEAEPVNVLFEIDDGGAERIELSGRLRMLSQMIPSAACQVASGYDAEYASGVLKSATDEFDRILTGIEFGDESLGIPTAEERRLTLAAIQDVRDAWDPLHLLVDHALDGTITNDELNLAFGESEDLLDAAKALVVHEVQEYSNPSQMAQAESFLIDIAGRQRMLIQMMSKDSCLAMHHNSEEESLQELASSMGTFEATLDALINGMAGVGIRPPPTPEIAEGLETVASNYAEIRPILQQIVDGGDIELDVAVGKFKALNELMGTMNGVVGLYTASVAE